MLLILRTLVHKGNIRLVSSYPKITYAACILEPPIISHPHIQAKEEVSKHRWTYPELAKTILEAAGTPLHYKEIARRAEELGVKEEVNLKSIHNVLGNDTDVFVQTDQGCYGLSAWGLVEIDTYPDIIADILKQSNKTLTWGELLDAVNSRRQIKHSSFTLYLSMHPRFYEAQDGTYGLRSWLPSREKQTLRTPKWMVETSKSRLRLESAENHGYHIEDIVSQDGPFRT